MFRIFKNRFYLSCVFAILFSICQAQTFFEGTKVQQQSYIPQSPVASELAKAIDSPVSLYTGSFSEIIPLYTILVDGISIPLDLFYSGKGVTVSQEATWVGLGWNLSAPFCITRTIRDGDDFHEYQDSRVHPYIKGYYDASEVLKVQDGDNENIKIGNSYDISNYQKTKIVDSEPDIFFFNLPTCSGKFLIDKKRGAVILSKNASNNVKIEFGGKSSAKTTGAKYEHTAFNDFTFTITDTHGNKYFFDIKETSSTKTEGTSLNCNKTGAKIFDISEDEINTNNYTYTYTSSWLLSRIETVHGQKVSFNYEKEIYTLPAQESAIKNNLISSSGAISSGGGTVPFYTQYSISKTLIDGYRLKSIIWNAGQVEFCASDRDDIKSPGYNYGSFKCKKLDKIIISNKVDKIIRQFQFDYSYMNDNVGMDNSINTKFGYVFKRLMLKQLSSTTDPSLNYKMEYYSLCPNSYTLNNHMDLPAKNSRNTDYWGYANGSKLEDKYYLPNGRNKANLEYARCGSLKTLTFPTGEKRTYTYELPAVDYQENPMQVNNPISWTIKAYKKNLCDLPYITSTSASKQIRLDKTTIVRIFGNCVSEASESNDPIDRYENENYPVFLVYKLDEKGHKTGAPIYKKLVPISAKDCNSYDCLEETYTLSAGSYLFEVFSPVADFYNKLTVSYNNPTTEYNNEIGKGPIRIKKISGSITRNFKYLSYNLYARPVTSYTLTKTDMYYHDASMTYKPYSVTYNVQSSESFINLCSIDNTPIYGYGRVSEERSDGIRVVSEFQNDNKDQEKDFPYCHYEENFQNGLILSKKTYKGNKLIQEVEYEYLDKAPQTVYGFVFNDEKLETYQYNIIHPTLYSEKVTNFEVNGNFTDETIYMYNNYFQLINEGKHVGKDLYSKVYKYPTDNLSEVDRIMAEKYIIGIPVLSMVNKNKSVLSAKRSVYSLINGVPVLSEEKLTDNKTTMTEANYTSFLVSKAKYSFFSSMYNAQELWSPELGYTTILWGYNGKYPIAELKNCRYSQVQQLLGDTFISNLEKNIILDSESKAKIDALRNSLPNSLISTFEYIPLVGTTSVKDANGVALNYAYDASGRLIKESYIGVDNKENILKTYKYNYNHAK